MLTPSENLLIRLVTAYCQVIKQWIASALLLGFMFYATASAFERYTVAQLSEQGIVPWALTTWAHHTLLELLPFHPIDESRDFFNGLIGMFYLTASPATAGLSVLIAYPLVLYCGIAVPIHALGLRLTPWPNVDLLLWPALGAIAQCVLVRRGLVLLRCRGWTGTAFRLQHGEKLGALLLMAVLVAWQLAVIGGYFAIAWLQIFLRWLFAA